MMVDRRQTRLEHGPMGLPPIDPRIRERRAEVRRRQKRRRLRALTGVLSLACLGMVGWGAARSPLLDVDSVRVEFSGIDTRRVDAALDASPDGPRTPIRDVVAASRAFGVAMVDLDGPAVARRIERLPWVRRATVSASWPATVRIEFVERTPVALVEAKGGGKMLVDGTGRVLARATDDRGLPLLVGIGPAGPPGRYLPPAARPLLAVAQEVPTDMVARLDGVASAGDQGGVELRLKPEGVARLGTPEQVGPKLAAVTAVLRQVDTTGLAVLDVRVPTSPVLTRRQVGTKVSTTITG